MKQKNVSILGIFPYIRFLFILSFPHSIILFPPSRAIWIFDRAYACLTYLAVRSFVAQVMMPVTLIYCEKDLDADTIAPFRALDVPMEVFTFDELRADQAVSSFLPEHYQGAVGNDLTNRLARFYVLKKYADELVFLLDADMAFTPLLASKIEDISLAYSRVPTIWGVVENERAFDGYLYFNKKDPKGDAIKVPPMVKREIFETVFGTNWEQLAGGFQFNNGLLACWQCGDLVDAWMAYYLKGIESPYVNPADDQLPLAAAIQATGIQVVKLPGYWNSLGKSSGDYVAYHVWAGFWKNALWRCMEGKSPQTDYGNIVSTFWNELPQSYLDCLQAQLDVSPFRYREIPGFFDFGGIYEDAVRTLPGGHLVEVGTYLGRSACFMAEMLQQNAKSFTFDTIDHFERSDTTKKDVEQTFADVGVSSFVRVIQAHSLQAVSLYADGSLAFVFLDGDSQLPSFADELRLWYQKLQPDGILAGYDLSIHDTVNKGYHCIVDAFCKEKQIPLRTYKQRFVIKKRTASLPDRSA